MSRRSTSDKQIRRLRKALRRTPNRYIDLVQYLMDRPYALNDRRKAQQMLLDGKVMVGSHKVGRLEIEVLGKKRWVLDPYIPADKQDQIVVVP